MRKFLQVNGLILAATALTVSIATADSVLVISLAGEAFEGPPSFDVMVGDRVIGSGTLAKAIETEKDGRLFTKARPSLFLEEFSFTVPDESLLPDKEITIVLTNDKFAEREGEGEDGILDRNLFIDFIRVNGLEVNSADMSLIKAGEVEALDYQAGLLPIYEAGHRVVIRPPEGGWPAPEAAASAVSVELMPPMPVLASWTLRALEQAR